MTTKNARFTLGGVEDLTPGLFVDGSPVNSPPGSADMADNVLFTLDGSLQARPGIAPVYTYPAGYTAPYLVQRMYQGDIEKVFSAHYQGLAVNGAASSISGNPRINQVVNASKRTLLLSDSNLYTLDGLVVTDTGTPAVTLTASASAGGTLVAGSYTYSLTLRDASGYETGAVKTVTVAVSASGSVQLVFNLIPLTYPTAVLYRKGPADSLPLYVGAVTLTSVSGSGVNSGNLTDNGLTSTGLTVPIRTFMAGGQAACFSANRLWVLNQNVMTYSDTGSPFVRGTFSTEPINLPDGGNATAIAPYNQGVIVFGLHSAVYITGPASAGGAILPLAITDGCINARAWTLVEGQLAFCGRQHVYVMNGQNATALTTGVQKLVRQASAVESTLVYSSRRQLLSLSLGDRLLTVQLRNNKPRAAVWTFSSYPQTVINDDLVLAQDTRLIVLNAENDEGVAVLASWRSTPQSLGSPHLWKLLRRAEVLILGGGTLNAQLAVGEAFGDGSPEFSDGVQSVLALGGKWNVGTWDSALWSARDAELRVKLSVPSEQQGNFLRFRIDFTTTSTSTTFVTAPIVCEYRSRERLGRS